MTKNLSSISYIHSRRLFLPTHCGCGSVMGTLCESKAGFILLCIAMMRLLQRCLKILILDAVGSFKHKLNSYDFFM